jgi:hypothetical protein
MSRFFVALLVCVACTFVACDSLVPPEPVGFTGLRGNISIVGGEAGWPTDTILDMRVVLFETAPTAADSILPFILSGRAAFGSAIPLRVAGAPYQVEVSNAPREFGYVVVAMQTGPNVLQDWRMAALYSLDGTTPAPVAINRGQEVQLNFTVDFANLPPQPF